MKAVTLDALDNPPALRDDLEPPSPGPGELLVRVRASSANPVDNAIAAGMLSGMFEHDFPVVLGRDYAGVVEQAGDASGYAAGEHVFGFVPHANPTVHDGSWAELITVAEDSIARAPAGVDLATAGAAPLAAITAMAAVDALELSDGDTLLDVVSYAPGAFDAALKESARVASPNSAAGDGPGHSNVMAASTPQNLERLAALLADGTLRVPVQATDELAEALDALTALGTQHTQGKLAIRIS